MNLKFVDVSQNDLRGEASVSVGSFFRRDNAVECLELAQTKIGCADLSNISEALCSRKQTLKEFNLSSNRIKHKGCAALSRFLAQPNCSVTWLDISWNELGLEGAIHLADALSVNTSIQHLNLSTNSLRDNGAQRIGASLLSNKTLVELSLTRNAVGEKACFVFSKVRGG